MNDIKLIKGMLTDIYNLLEQSKEEDECLKCTALYTQLALNMLDIYERRNK
jgi:hypothetical protein